MSNAILVEKKWLKDFDKYFSGLFKDVSSAIIQLDQLVFTPSGKDISSIAESVIRERIRPALTKIKMMLKVLDGMKILNGGNLDKKLAYKVLIVDLQNILDDVLAYLVTAENQLEKLNSGSNLAVVELVLTKRLRPALYKLDILDMKFEKIRQFK